MSSQVTIVTMYQNRAQFSSQTLARIDNDFQIRNLNDFTTEWISKERTDYEDSDTLSLVGVCPSRHGGLLDYPKIVTGSAGWVTEKWELCLRLVRPEFYSCSDRKHTEDWNNPSLQSQPQPEDPENSEENFQASVSESANKLILHHAWLTELLVKSGDFEKLAGVAGGLALIRNKLWQFNEEVLPRDGAGMFSSLYRETCDLVESLCQQMTLYYSNTLNTIVIIDSDSQDWEDPKPFHEGERVSYCVQMWWYSMETSRQYLWSSLPPTMSQNIFLSVLNQSLSTLTHRYTNISPSASRLPQYRADILAVLLAVSELLPCVSEDLASLQSCRPEHVVLRSVHTKCELLLTILVTVTAPASHLQSSLNTGVRLAADWRSLLCPASHSLYQLSRLVSDLPHPDWALMVQLCLSSQSTFPSVLLTHMGAFVCEVREGEPVRCGSTAQCLGACLGAGDTTWPLLTVMGSLLPLALSQSATSLARALKPLFSKLTLASWECLQATNIWNIRNPVWMAAIINILQPFLSPAVCDVLQAVEDGKTWTLSHVNMAKKLLLENITELLESVPDSVVGCLLYVRTSTPATVHPLANSAVAQLVVSTVYQAILSVIPVVRSHRVQKEKVDFLLALCESLCTEDTELDLGMLDARLEANLDSKQVAELESLSSKSEEQGWEGGNERFEMIAYSVLQQEQNKVAFMALHRFIRYNSDWIGWALGVDHFIGQAPALQPWNSVPAPHPRPAQIMQKIGCIRFDSLMDIKLGWKELCDHVMETNNNPILYKLFHLRPAFNEKEASYLPPTELQANLDVRDLLLIKSNI